MQLNEQKCSQLPDEVKMIFDEIAAELAIALRNVKSIKRGVPVAQVVNLARNAEGEIRRAIEKCSICGIKARGQKNYSTLN